MNFMLSAYNSYSVVTIQTFDVSRGEHAVVHRVHSIYCPTLIVLTYKVDSVWNRSGSQWSRVFVQALIKKENSAAVVASLKADKKYQSGDYILFW